MHRPRAENAVGGLNRPFFIRLKWEAAGPLSASAGQPRKALPHRNQRAGSKGSPLKGLGPRSGPRGQHPLVGSRATPLALRHPIALAPSPVAGEQGRWPRDCRGPLSILAGRSLPQRLSRAGKDSLDVKAQPQFPRAPCSYPCRIRLHCANSATDCRNNRRLAATPAHPPPAGSPATTDNQPAAPAGASHPRAPARPATHV
jgi:hypothetical protein